MKNVGAELIVKTKIDSYSIINKLGGIILACNVLVGNKYNVNIRRVASSNWSNVRIVSMMNIYNFLGNDFLLKEEKYVIENIILSAENIIKQRINK